MTERYCRACKGWHDVDGDWPSACLTHFKAYSAGGMQIIKDIEPYRSTITQEVIGGRRQHRDHLRAHSCIEIGTEKQKPKDRAPPPGLKQDLKRAVEKHFG